MSIFGVSLKKLVDDSYDIEIGFSLERKLIKDLKTGLAGNIKKFAIITDSNVEKLYAGKIASLLEYAGFTVNVFAFPAGEKSKTRETKAFLEDRMIEKEYRRDCCIIAVGGGVVTDLAGFIAGTYGRGVPFINYATSLLAAADASVGGKTAVDTPAATNLIGLFNQPKKVYIDIGAWQTLPKRELRSGMAETIKHACMADKDFFQYLKENMSSILANDKEACEHIAEKNCQIKYHVVEKDEMESGLREILNLGHTVGRAIETVSEYRLLHGEAVSIGLMAEALLAKKLGYLTDKEANEMKELLILAELPVEIPDYIDKDLLVKKLYTDKKVKDGKLRFVIQKGIGSIVEFEPNVFATRIEEDVIREIIFQM